MKSAVFALASLTFALGLAGTLGVGYGSSGYAGYDSYNYGGYSGGYSGGYGNQGYSGYGHKGGVETTQYIPYAVPVPQPAAPLPAFGGDVGGSSGGIFGDDGLWLLMPVLFLFLLNNNNSG